MTLTCQSRSRCTEKCYSELGNTVFFQTFSQLLNYRYKTKLDKTFVSDVLHQDMTVFFLDRLFFSLIQTNGNNLRILQVK